MSINRRVFLSNTLVAGVSMMLVESTSAMAGQKTPMKGKKLTSFQAFFKRNQLSITEENI